MRILLADPTEVVGRAIELMLRVSGFNVECVPDTEDAMTFAVDSEFDAIVMELDAKDSERIAVVRKYRVRNVTTPVVFISGSHSMMDICNALDVGDDYIRAPFHRDELVARVNAVVRRSRGLSTQKVDVGGLVVDLRARSATVHGKPLHLTGKEYGLLEALVLRQGNLMTKEALLTALYGGMDEPELKIIDVFICKLRKKLKGSGWDSDCLATVWGRGYVIHKPGLAA